jgi:cytochrome c oxidase subunit II
MRRRAIVAIASLAAFASGCSGSGPQSSLNPKGSVSREIDDLWRLVLVMATIVFVIVMAVMLYSMIRYRERPGDDREPKQVHGNTPLEITWTIIPAVILAVLAVPTLRTLFDVRSVPTGDDVLQISVTGHQWWWEFEYPNERTDDGRTIVTANELHIPANTVVYLTMTSADVIHSFWVPPLNGKRDVVPGRITNLKLEADEPTPPGQPLLGQCAEFCGLAHADMRVKVVVHDQAGFDEWAAHQLEPSEVPTTDELAVAGYETFTQVCTTCHQATVVDADRILSIEGARLAPNLTHFSSRGYFGGAVFENTDEHLRAWLRNPSAVKPMHPEYNDLEKGRLLGMPNFELSETQIDELVALLRSWD